MPVDNMPTPHTSTAPLTYLQARPHIHTGDYVGISTGTVLGRVIHGAQAVAGLPDAHITHCGVAMWTGGRLMLLEMGAVGNVQRPLSQYAKKRMVVCPAAPGTNLSLFDLGLDHITDRPIPYGFFDLISIGLRLLPMRLIDTRQWGGDGDRDKVCSLLPTMVYRALGGDVSAIPDLAAPAEVALALNVKLRIEQGAD
jgi:hypothetical protein